MTRTPRVLVSVAVAVLTGALLTGAGLAGAGPATDRLGAARVLAPAPPPAAPGPPRLRPVDGGPDFHARFADGLPVDPSYFPIGLWYQDVPDLTTARDDAAAGITTYVELTEGSDLDAVRRAGMSAIVSGPRPGPVTGWLLADEADMWAGPGEAPWTGSYPGQGEVCAPVEAPCGYTVQQTLLDQLPADGRLRFANYGKGVLFGMDDADAARFVNAYQDVVSVDAYWSTDGHLCGEGEGARLLGTEALDADRRLPDALCHRAANYGLMVDRVRSLVQPAGSRPVWAFVELGHPSTDDAEPSITAAQVRAAVWSSLVHEARGIVYFGHSFGGPCPTQHALRDPCYADVRATVTELHEQLRSLAPVLNAPTVDGATTVAGDVDVLTKYSGGDLHLLATATGEGASGATFRVGCAGDATVSVFGEQRSVPMTGGVFSDRFAGAGSTHVYEVPDGAGCRF
ncbi:hypothetical protein GB931_16250 [Modestobacter sp. I12A-02628]|uniref:Uncharacterized protein n=1 Tax=Goekera deserti TaxID=2497753 RepID=A0A7K3WJA5_9ACTN|nr:hypothetical protein [Goekera deserti]MPQ99440.1 hypothetical protein [Goekera deserti]NDI48927.1 hypothetical protein [Goekera deserti]NEL55603.1 hypothetical protein [Goekera deserti]